MFINILKDWVYSLFDKILFINLDLWTREKSSESFQTMTTYQSKSLEILLSAISFFNIELFTLKLRSIESKLRWST